MTETLRHPTRGDGNHALFVTAVVLLAAACGLAVWWMVIRSTSSAKQPAATASGAVAVSQDGLETLASLGRPIYWAGAKPGDTYELTQAAGGRIYVRYLPAGVDVGSTSVYLTVATYPVRNAFAVTKQVAGRAGSVRVRTPDGGVAFYRSSLPTNVYLAYPASDYQIEVFDPSPRDARKLVASGTIAQVAASAGASVPKSAPVAVSTSGLQQIASRLSRSLYWAGPEARTTYELTQTPDGRLYVRYLPVGTAVGTARPYLTIGTYPMKNAFATTKAAAKAPGAVAVKVPGGIAFYSTSRPTSVYVAFPRSDEQIEVYDPSASVARAAVVGRRIRAVS